MYTVLYGFMWDYRAALRRRGLAGSTVAKYVAMAERWREHVGDPFDAALSWRDVEAFVDGGAMRAARSRYAAVSALHQFYLWAMRAGLADHDPTVLVVRPRTVPGTPRPIGDTDLALALTVATGPVRAGIVLAAHLGLRAVELTRLRWADVGVDRVRVHGKADRVRTLPMPAPVRDVLDDLDRVDEWVLPWREAADVSPGRRASHAINAFLHGIGVDATAHTLRHWCGTRAYAECGDIGIVQDYLGHASPATTKVYARTDPSRLRAVADAIALPGVVPMARNV